MQLQVAAMDIVQDELDRRYTVNTMCNKIKSNDIIFVKIIAQYDGDEDTLRTTVRNILYFESNAEQALYKQFVKFNTLKMELVKTYIDYVKTFVHPTVYAVTIVNEMTDAYGFTLTREDIRSYILEKGIQLR